MDQTDPTVRFFFVIVIDPTFRRESYRCYIPNPFVSSAADSIVLHSFVFSREEKTSLRWISTPAMTTGRPPLTTMTESFLFQVSFQLGQMPREKQQQQQPLIAMKELFPLLSIKMSPMISYQTNTLE